MNGQLMKNKWLYWFKIILGVGILSVLYSQISRTDSIGKAFLSTDWVNVTLCIVLLIPNIYLAFLKWFYLLHKKFPDISAGEVFGSLLFGYTLGLITPGRLGELGRGLFFQQRDKAVITGLNIIDKAFNQLVFFTLGCFSLWMMYLGGYLSVWEHLTPVLIPGTAIIALIWFLLFNPALIRRLLNKFATRNRVKLSIFRASEALTNFTRRDSLVVLGLSLVWILVVVLQYHVLVLAFTGVSVWESFRAVTATLFIKTLLPITFGDLGIREGIAIFFFSEFQVSRAAVFNASLLIFVINFLTPAISGIYFLFRLKSKQPETEIPLVTEIVSDQYQPTPTPVNSDIAND